MSLAAPDAGRRWASAHRRSGASGNVAGAVAGSLREALAALGSACVATEAWTPSARHVATAVAIPDPVPAARAGASQRGKEWATVAARAVLAAAVVAVAVMGLGLAVGPRTGAYRTVTMLTGSMRPGMPVGSVLVVRPQPVSRLRPGQVLTYSIPVDDHRVVSHRVVSVTPGRAGGYDVVTKGDANNGRDPWTAHISDRTVWTVRAVVPHLGSALLALRDPRLLPWLLYGGPAFCAAWVLMGVWRTT